MLCAVLVLGLILRFVLSWNSVINLPPSADESISQLLADAISRGEQYPLLFSGQPYQFPLEAYLMSLFSDMLPNNAFGARIQPFVFRLLTMGLLCAMAVKVFDKGKRLPTLALILIPSAYWLVYQAGYFVPQHNIFALISALSFLIAIHLNSQTRPAFLLTLSVGILSGLSISNHLLAASVVLGIFLIVVFTGSRRVFFQRTPVFVGGLLLGLIPYFMAIYTIDGAYDAIVSRLDPGVFFYRFFSTVIGHALPGAMGINPPRFPDFSDHIDSGNLLRLLFVTAFLLVLFASIASRVHKFYIHSIAERWPQLQWPDMFLVITIASIGLMAMNSASHWSEHRYLLPVVWSFPFLIGYIYSWGNSLVRYTVGGFTVALVIVNLMTSITVIEDWRKPKDIQPYADIPDLTHFMSWMQEQNIHHCYATFWQTYRVTYESGGTITCAPVYNERFIEWPIPYKDEVNQQTRVAYLLSHTHQSRYSFVKFEKRLSAYGIAYQRKQFGKYFAYYDFLYPPAEGEMLLAENEYELSSNINQAQALMLKDRNLARAWEVKQHQKMGQNVELAFRQQQNVQRVDIVYPNKDSFPANSVRIFGRRDNVWIELVGELKFEADLLSFYNNHPVLGELSQTIRFDPQWLDAIRIEIVSARQGKQWTLSEVRVGVLDD